jgi:signal transduction histidine kinase
MKRTALEPGLLQALRMYVLVAAVMLAFTWRVFSPMLGVDPDSDFLIRPNLPVLIFLAIYTFVPWWQERMGRAFLPTALGLFALQGMLGNYISLLWSVPPDVRELGALAFMLRLWVNIQFIVFFVAWQYDLFSVTVTGVGLSLLDAALSFPFMDVNGPLYPLFMVIVSGRLICVTAAGLGLAWLMKRQREHRGALAEANRKLAQYAATTEHLAVSQERNRLARELHDTLAHSLSGVTVQLEAVEALWDANDQDARRMLDQALLSTRSGLTEARRALQSLRASPLEDLGLALAITDLVESAAARANLKLELNINGHLEDIPMEIEQSVYRIVQEALTNVSRHAQATSLHVALTREEDCLSVLVRDDGHGFDPAEVSGARYGLKGLRERAEMMGGALQIDSNPQGGTSVRLQVPVGEARV